MRLKAIVLLGVYVVLTGYLAIGVYADSYKRKYNPLAKDGFCYIPDHTKAVNVSSSIVLSGGGRIVWANGQISTSPVTASGASWGVIGGTIGDQSDLMAKFNSVSASTTTLKGITDSHTATLAQVGTATETLAGMIGSSTGSIKTILTQVQTDTGTISGMLAFDSSGNATKSTTYDGSNVLTMNNPISFSLSDGEYAMKIDGAFSGIQYLGNTNGIRISAALSGVPYSARPIDLSGSYVTVGIGSTITAGGAAIFAGSVTANGGFYGNVSNCTGFPAATVPASISVDTITVGGTPALDGYPVSVNGDVLVSSGVLYLRNSQLLLAHPDGETSVYLLSTDSDSYNADILMQSGSTLTVTGSGGNKSHYVQNGNITCDYIQGDGSRLTGLAGGDMVQATHGVAIAASTSTLYTQINSTYTALLNGNASSLTKATYDVSVTTAGVCTGNAATATSAASANYALNLPTTTFAGVKVGSATIADRATYALNLPTATFAGVKSGSATIADTLSAKLAIAKGGTNQTTYNANKFLYYDGSKITDSNYFNTDFATPAQVNAVALSTGMFTTVASATTTLRSDLTAAKQSTGAVCYESHYIVYGNTQAFVTNLSTQPASPMQSAPLGAFTISSATARVIDGTSATIRLFITDKSNEYSVVSATPIWSSAVTAGTSRTGGTLANVAVGVDNRIMVVIDAIAGAVKYLDIAVRGNR